MVIAHAYNELLYCVLCLCCCYVNVKHTEQTARAVVTLPVPPRKCVLAVHTALLISWLSLSSSSLYAGSKLSVGQAAAATRHQAFCLSSAHVGSINPI